MPLLSVIVPVYNEAKTIRLVLEKIQAVLIDKEIIVVDDASTDDTGRILRETNYHNLKVVHQVRNYGKGQAVRTGIANASGEYVIIQDADLEYEPREYTGLLKCVQEGGFDLAIGVRFTQTHTGLRIQRFGNKAGTALINTLYHAHLNDYASCYKLARKSTFMALHREARSFTIDAEIVCNALRKGLRIAEVPISYTPRTYAEGKKIGWLDGVCALYYILKCRLRRQG